MSKTKQLSLQSLPSREENQAIIHTYNTENGTHVREQRNEVREGTRNIQAGCGRDTLVRMVRESLLARETITERLMEVESTSRDPLMGEPAG